MVWYAIKQRNQTKPKKKKTTLVWYAIKHRNQAKPNQSMKCSYDIKERKQIEWNQAKL